MSTELCRLTTDPGLASLAGRLAAEWLQCYPALNLHVLRKLLPCTLENAPNGEMLTLLVDARNRAHPDRDTKLLWLSADYAVNFERHRYTLLEAAAKEPKFIWAVRDRVAPDRRDRSDSDGGKRLARFSLAQLSFIVEAFGRKWPWTRQPSPIYSWHWEFCHLILRTRVVVRHLLGAGI